MSKLDIVLDLPRGMAASRMLSAIVPEQRWGIPRVVPERARVRFKGGWRPSDAGLLVNQAARIDKGGKSYGIAILTDGNPDQAYGERTISLIAAALLR